MPKYGQDNSFYKLQSIAGHPKSYRITKFDVDLNVESSYIMNFISTPDGGYHDCQCPAAKFDCRHKEIMKAIIAANAVDSDKFFSFRTKTFRNAEEVE